MFVLADRVCEISKMHFLGYVNNGTITILPQSRFAAAPTIYKSIDKLCVKTGSEPCQNDTHHYYIMLYCENMKTNSRRRECAVKLYYTNTLSVEL
jgi:hypothetical protein